MRNYVNKDEYQEEVCYLKEVGLSDEEIEGFFEFYEIFIKDNKRVFNFNNRKNKKLNIMDFQ